jgi:hypothetical protein
MKGQTAPVAERRRPHLSLSSIGEPWWTDADAAELDVLTYELCRGYFADHRERCAYCQPGDCSELIAWREHLAECAACRGDAPLAYGLPCHRKREFIKHGDECKRCNPCPYLRRAIDSVVDRREARALLSRAEYLRAERDRIAGRAA